MGYEIVDVEKSSRKKAYDKFINAKNPMMTMTSKVDITRLYKLSKKGFKLNCLLMYAIIKAAEKNENFYYELKGKQLVKFDKLSSNVVIYGDDGELYYVTIPDCQNYLLFEKTYVELVEKCKKECSHYYLSDAALLGTSAVVNSTFESIVCGYTEDFLSHFLTWGKYEKRLTKVNLNISFRFHHALLDGRDVGEFFANLNKIVADFKIDSKVSK